MKRVVACAALAVLAGALRPTALFAATAATFPPMWITSSSALLSGNVKTDGASVMTWFEYGLTPSYGSQTPPQEVSSSQDFTRAVFGLACGTIYHFRIVAGTVAGADRTFATAICPAPGLSGDVQSLAVDPTNGQIVYAGTTDGVFRTDNGGATWSRVYSGSPTSVTALAIDPHNRCRIYAGIDAGFVGDPYAFNLPVLRRSTDCGATWTTHAVGPFGRQVQALSFTSGNPAALYVSYVSNIFTFRPPFRFFTVALVSDTEVHALPLASNTGPLVAASDPTDPCAAYVGGQSGVVSRNDASCGNWAPVGGALSGEIWALAPHPSSPGRILAGTLSGRVYRKMDHASPWTEVAFFPSSIGAIAYDRVDPLIAYATAGGVLYRTSDGGTTWTPSLTIGTSVDFGYRALATGAAAPATAYAGGPSFVFAIGAPAPIVSTLAATGLTAFAATLHGAIDPNGNQTSARFEYGLSTSYGNVVAASPALVTSGSPASVSAAIAGLACETTYHFRVLGVSSASGTAYGAKATFVTGPCPRPPRIAAVPNRTTRRNIPASVTVALGGGAAGPAALVVSARSSNQVLVPDASLVVGGGGSVRVLTIAPAPGQTGAATIAITASDGVEDATASFVLTVVRAASAGDFDGDVRADVSVYRPENGTWYLRSSSTGSGAAYPWGAAGDVPVAGDYDGDGTDDIAVYRPASAHWFILKSSTDFTSHLTVQWGAAGDSAVPADYDGDGTTDIAVYRPSTGAWYVRRPGVGFSGYEWGADGDIPLPCDYDGDGRADVAVYRPSTGHWFVLWSSTDFEAWGTYQWGTTGDVPVASDYDGDGRADLAMFRPANGTWYILKSTTGFTGGAGYQWGAADDVPVPADYDGDGRTDIAFYRPSSAHWFILHSSTSHTTSSTYQWGTAGDIPVLRR